VKCGLLLWGKNINGKYFKISAQKNNTCCKDEVDWKFMTICNEDLYRSPGLARAAKSRKAP
jgi:hypothetical protein